MCTILTIHRMLFICSNVIRPIHEYGVITIKADEEMKREQERRITQDKKDSVHQQLLHTVCYCISNHKSPSVFIFPL